ncbi:MAG: hypothetical protein HOO06_16125 [Bdellovibrionaceae bacterium]|jgi:hypothetical protein|nr:hypothetical protein [Pseudobdellovibrionaceae bacterium]
MGLFRMFFQIICVLALVLGCTKEEDKGNTVKTAPPVNLNRINISGVSYYGIFDPSIARDPFTDTLWMSYSVVDQSHIGEQTVQLKLASSIDNGVTWIDSGETLSSYADFTSGTIDLINDVINEPASWKSETSSLIYDASAPSNQRWKLIFWRYMVADKDPATPQTTLSYFVELGWIAYKTASSPLGLATATEQKLMKGFAYNSAANSIGTPAFSPVSGDAAIDITTDFTSTDPGGHLTQCGGLHEPGALAASDALYLSFTCSDFSDSNSRNIVLFRCTNPCDATNPSSWTYIGKIFSDAKAQSIDSSYLTFDAPNLFEYNSEYYVIVTPVMLVGSGPDSDYNGCEVYKFSSISSGTLEEVSGVPSKYISYVQPSNIFNGACTYHQSINDLGLIQSYIELTGTPTDYFRIHSTDQGFW